MASGLVSFAGPALSAAPGVGWVAGIAAGFFDAYVLAPALSSKPKLDNKLLDVPTGVQGIGAPVTLAYGRRIRIQGHVLWQSRKQRETLPSQKSGSQIVQRQVFVNALVAVNARYTEAIVQLIGNGRLLAWTERNLIGVTSPYMLADWPGATPFVVVRAGNLGEESFAKTFRTGDIVLLNGFVCSNPAYNAVINGTYWLVDSVLDHGAVPSNMSLRGIRNQNLAVSGSATGGTANQPARVRRIDTAKSAYRDCNFVAQNNDASLRLEGVDLYLWRQTFLIGDQVRVIGLSADVSANVYKVKSFFESSSKDTIRLQRISGSANWSPPYLSTTLGTLNNQCIVIGLDSQFTTPGFFPSDYNLPDNFTKGTETQGEHPLLVEQLQTGNVPGYRGVAYLALEDMNITELGGNLPGAIDFIAEPDPEATLQSVITDIFEDLGIPTVAKLDVSGVIDRPIDGVYLQGAQAPSTSLQPLLMAYRLLTQEVNDTLKIFHIENAEVFALQNDALYTDCGWAEVDGFSTLDPLQFEDPAIEKLPTTVGARYQDPDFGYADRQETHSLRNPNAPDHEFSVALDFSTLAIRRYDVKNILTTTLRMAWINAVTFRTSLSGRWLNLLENDLIRVPDDAGVIYIGRIIQRDIVGPWLVQVTCVVEDPELSVTGSNVTEVSVIPPGGYTPAQSATFVILDIPSYQDETSYVPMLAVAAATPEGAQWGGASIWQSMDGTTWTQSGFISEQTVIGELTATLDAASDLAETEGSGTAVFDNSNTLEFQVIKDLGLAAVTEGEALDGANWFAILDDTNSVVEIIAAQDITDDGAGAYSATNLLRGLRGTDLEAGTDHPAGSRIVQLVRPNQGEGALTYISYPGIHQPAGLQFKILSPGQSLDDVEAITLTAGWRNAVPLRLRKKSLLYSLVNDITVETTNRTKQMLPVAQVGPYGVDEPEETYVFRLFTNDWSSLEIERTLTSAGSGSSTLRDKFVTFTAAELTAAGYTPSGSLVPKIDILQVGNFGVSKSMELLP